MCIEHRSVMECSRREIRNWIVGNRGIGSWIIGNRGIWSWIIGRFIGGNIGRRGIGRAIGGRAIRRRGLRSMYRNRTKWPGSLAIGV